MEKAVWLAHIFQVPPGAKLRVLSSSATCRHLHQDFDNILSSLMTFFKLAVGETHFFQGMLGKFFAQNIPICSMYGIFTYIWLRIMVIPGAFGIVSNHTREMLLFLTNNQFLTDEYFAPLLGGGYMFHPYLGKWSILTSILGWNHQPVIVKYADRQFINFPESRRRKSVSCFHVLAVEIVFFGSGKKIHWIS